MNHPAPNQFEEFYRAINGFDPFPWHTRLAALACAGNWPHAIALPTAAGKTTCIDIALFALASRAPNAARRIFFVVDRRIVVDQAYDHAMKLATLLRAEAATGIVRAVADSLRDLAQDERPLDVYALRGGMYRESAWTRSPLQPTVIASTVDQVGSRLLFRGYGVSDSMRPIHAGLVANDSLILLDEAHCAKPFDQTMQAVKSYRGWNESRTPFAFVSMTATPTVQDNVMRADDADYRHPILGERIKASKPATLVVAERAKGKNGVHELVKKLDEQARGLSGQDLGTDKNGTQHRVECVGIIVNRVKTARLLRDSLRRDFGDEVVLLTGRMRPVDRDRIFDEKLRPLLSNAEGKRPKFVIGTQCLECGADFDFHALVTECASLDALRQRFGRLNRVANRPSAKAVVIIRGDETEDTNEDPVYGESLANTWKWLKEKAANDVIDFGVSAMNAAIDGIDLDPYNAPTEDAPVLFPAHLDCWVQTHPIPTPDPDPAIFLHGPMRTGQPDVQLVFRSDLGDDANRWAEVVALCPPSSSEAVSVPIGVFKNWLAEKPMDDQSGDVQGEEAIDDDSNDFERTDRAAVCWRGPAESDRVIDPREVRPNQVYVLPISPAIISLADFPTDMPADFAEEAFLVSRDKAILRLPGLSLDEDDDEFDAKLSDAIRAEIAQRFPGWSDRVINSLLDEKRRVVESYPEPLKGFVVSGRNRLGQFEPTYLEDSEPAESYRGRRVSLEEHSYGVAKFAKRFAQGCGLDAELYHTVGLYHDLGKLDPRFQAMLKQTSPHTAVGPPLAKSSKSPRSLSEREEARQVHGYPKGARHELLSVAILEKQTDDDLLLHLIATHHGSARPFASAVTELDFVEMPVRQSLFGLKPDSCRQDIAAWNAILPERFWRIVRKLGWWGSAYHEAVFRLADHAQSRWEQEYDEKQEGAKETRPIAFARKQEAKPLHTLPLPGLDGSNPLAFLAALGTLVACNQFEQQEGRPDWVTSPVRLSWGTYYSPYIPILHFEMVPPSPAQFVDFLIDRLPRSIEKHPAAWVVRMLEIGNKKGAVRDFNIVRKLVIPQRRDCRPQLDWVTALSCESALDADSQLQTVRCDYLLGNLKSLLQLVQPMHLHRSLFVTWDYADGLANQSLHWEPTEDRRHAYQWHMPSGDPTRKRSGGMLGANRLAIEAWPLFPSFSDGDRVNTRGFRGNRANNTFWTWPLWRFPATSPVIESLMSIRGIQEDQAEIDKHSLRQMGIVSLFRLQRILVGKTPNFTTAIALA